MNNDERWIHDSLAAVVDDSPPPADLADRAEHTARRIVRRRVAAAAVAVVGVVAVPVLTGGWTFDRAARLPAATQPAGPCEDAPDPVGVSPAAHSGPVTWSYRGEPALRPLATPDLPGTRFTDLHPLLGVRLPGGGTLVMSAARQQPTGSWWFAWSATDASGARLGGGGGLEQLGPEQQFSVFAPVGSGAAVSNALVVLGPPGADSVSWTGCRDGVRVDARADGDVLVADVGGPDDAGRVTVRDDDRVVYSGVPSDAGYLRPAGPTGVPESSGAPEPTAPTPTG